MIGVGLQIGNVATKVVANGKTVCFPSVAVPAYLVDMHDGLRAVRTAYTLADGSQWVTGQQALYSPYAMQHTSAKKYETREFQALALAAMQAVMPQGLTDDVLIFAGQPGAWFKQKANVQAMQQSLEAALSHWADPYTVNIKVVPDVAGVYFRSVSMQGFPDPKQMQGITAALDLGYRDVGVGLWRNGVLSDMTSIPHGAARLVEAVKLRLLRLFTYEGSDALIDLALRKGSMMMDGNKFVFLDDAVIRTKMAAHLQLVLNEIERVLNTYPRVERLVVGGGALLMPTWAEQIFERFGSVVVVPGWSPSQGFATIAQAESHLCGVRGFEAIASMQAVRSARS